jgi:hypothetical protein
VYNLQEHVKREALNLCLINCAPPLDEYRRLSGSSLGAVVKRNIFATSGN